MALLTRIELAATRSTVESRHQLGPGASCSFCNNGAAAETRTRMHEARAPRARVSTVPPRPRNRLFEVPIFGRTSFELEDQVGLEPTVTCVDGLRIRSLGRWGHWSMIGGSGWFRTTCARVKRPLHLQSGLTLRIHRPDGCGGKPRRLHMAQAILALMVVPSGIEPASPGYRPDALPLCYETSGFGRRTSSDRSRGDPAKDRTPMRW
jgi:hypothetical protein